MRLSESAEGLGVLQRRIFLEGDREPIPDPDGFVLPIGEALAPRDLLKEAAVLAVAPPWTGKTTVAKELSTALKGSYRYSELTCFEERERGAPVQPSWWEEWKAGDDSAFWIVDALDEDARKDKQSLKILQLIRDLPERACARLHLIAFCRINEIPDWFEGRLNEIFGAWSPGRPLGLRRLRLAGLDRETARMYVGQGRFDRICHLIRSNDLQTLAPYPAVLKHLATRAESESLTKEEVWEGVLTDLLREKRDDPLQPSFGSEIEDRFAVAQKLAALTTFCGIREIAPDIGLESVFPSTLPGYPELRVAARETLKTAVFERSDRGFRFCQDHVRQWLAAFALRDMSLLQVRPLLTLESGELDPSHEGVMGLLAQITRYPEVKDWIVTAHGGLPNVDTGIWSLEEASHALDKLQELARSSPWGLSLWREERLQSFGKVAGIGEEIARRLEGSSHPAEQQFLLATAMAIDAREPIQPAIQLLRDEEQDERARAMAADFVSRLGAVEHLTPLSEWIRSPGRGSTRSAEIVPILVSAFYRRGIWSFEEAATLALSRAGLSGDWLQYELAEDLSLNRAQWLIGNCLLPEPELAAQHLAGKALEKILEQEAPTETDMEILIPLVLTPKGLEQRRFGSNRQIIRFLERSQTSRRRLFLEGLRLDPQRQGDNAWAWTRLLDGEDAEWLLNLLRELRGEPAWLWEILHHLSSRKGVPQRIRRRVRRELRLKDLELLKHLDRARKTWAQSERRWREQSKKEQAPSYELRSLVHETLEAEELELCRKMLRLSWCCFKRQSNVSGQWEDLPAEVHSEVFAVCQQALAQCPPTVIPDGSSFSSWTSLEAACFDHLVKEDAAFVLASELIRKWLPSLLRDWVTGSGYEATLRRCFEVDCIESEDVFVEAVLRAVRSESGSIYLVQQLPPDLWSERLASRLEQEIVLNEEAASDTRIDFLGRIGRIFPFRARTIALAWAEEVSPPADTRALRDAGIDLLLMVAPQEGWERLKRLIQQENPLAVLRRMRSLLPHHYGPDADFNSWPAARLGELEELLFQAFPPEADPQWVAGEVRSLGGDDDLRSLRDRLPSLLYQRDGEGDRAILDRLADIHPRIREWLNDVLVQQGAEGVLAGLGRGGHPPGTERKVPLQLMVKLLQDSKYRVLGTADDLQDVILEQLRFISREAKQHLSMLYRPKEKGAKRKRLHEDALQAYLACRLTDRLPGVLGERGLKIEPSVDRETLAARDTRNDLKIQAPSLDGSRLTVIIEVKWSDNDEVSTSQVEQLAKDYLHGNGLTHGIYLMGWSGLSGPWKPEALGEPPEPRSSLEAWQKALKAQTDLLIAQFQELRVEPFVMDLAWDREEPART